MTKLRHLHILELTNALLESDQADKLEKIVKKLIKQAETKQED